MTAIYQPLYIKGFEAGLVQNREEFILPNDAYPILENALIYREAIKRRQGLSTLGRLRRSFLNASIGNSAASPWTFNLFAVLTPPISNIKEPNAEIEVGSLIIDVGGSILIDQGNGTLQTSPVSGISGTVNYVTGDIVITGAGAGLASTATFNYFPGLPVMGLRTRELTTITNEQMVAFDTRYAYRFASNGFIELASSTPTTWSGDDSDFFWSTNYWVDASNNKLFWVTNFSGPNGDPIRYYNGVTWTDFTPQIDSAGNFLQQSLAILPFRGRLVTFNTWEGMTLLTSTSFQQRIRWAAIGNPLTTNAWRDDITGQGGFLDIPTSEAITAVGFVRDNLVIYTDRSTWQLRYTGRSIAPFQIEKINSELGAASLFSAIQFDKSLVGIGDKGIVECDSYQSVKIDIKIPDLVFQFEQINLGPLRVHGIRDQQQRLAYWIYPYNPALDSGQYYPNRRLVYNYENGSWAIFTDTLTALGTYQAQNSLRWEDCNFPWTEANFPWLSRPALFPSLVGGNQQGFVMYLGSNMTPKVSNDPTLSITDIQGNDPDPTVITSPLHNLVTGQIISITDIPLGTPFDNLNNGIFYVDTGDLNQADTLNKFKLFIYNPKNGEFTLPQTDDVPLTPYVGGGRISVRDNFDIVSKKFNFLDQGQNIQIGFFDILTSATDEGAFSVNIYVDYNDNSPVNILPENNMGNAEPDPFFNQIIPTSQQPFTGLSGTKYFQRVYCTARGAFLTLEYTLNNLQMIGVEQESNVQIDTQTLWVRPAGRLQSF